MSIHRSVPFDLDTIMLSPICDLGDGLHSRRALPSLHRRMVGPFIFLEHLGPRVFESGDGFEMQAHPHIGLASVTYLIDGELIHRDSLGGVETIRPGEVNWMIAGSGIVHSERASPESRASGSDLLGIQAWVALPARDEEAAPDFAHFTSSEVPGAEIVLRAPAFHSTRLLLLGGEPFAEPRHIYWNFVSSSPERIEQAKADWREGRFAPVPGERGFIPLP